MAKGDAVWVDLDVNGLPGEAKVAFEAYKEMYRQAKAKRIEFEEAMNKLAELPKGMKMVFGYNFGKLSAAIVPDTSKPKAATPAKMSLAEFLRNQQAAGRQA